MKITDITGNLKCDYGHIFEAQKVELKKFGNGFSAPMASIRFIDENKTIFAGQPKENDLVLACPLCHKVHLFGFDRVSVTTTLKG